MNYSEAELDRLLDAAAEVVLATVTADPTGVVAYFREMRAAGRYLYEAERRYADNELVQRLLAMQEQQDPQPTEGRRKLSREQLLERISEVGEILEDDANSLEFKRFLYGLAETIARASGLAFSSRISMDEQEFLDELRARLRLPEDAA